MGYFDVWTPVLLNPGETITQAHKQLPKGEGLRDGVGHLLLAALLGGVILAFRAAFQSDAGFGSLLVAAVALLAIAGVAGSAFTAGGVHLAARYLFKSGGEFRKYYFLYAICTSAGIMALSVALLLPVFGEFASLLIAAYLFYLQVLAVKQAYGLDTAKAVASLVIPAIAYILLLILLLGVLVLLQSGSRVECIGLSSFSCERQFIAANGAGFFLNNNLKEEVDVTSVKLNGIDCQITLRSVMPGRQAMVSCIAGMKVNGDRSDGNLSVSYKGADGVEHTDYGVISGKRQDNLRISPFQGPLPTPVYATPTATKPANLKPCDKIDWQPPELTFAVSYCQGDMCNETKNKSECEKIDVVVGDKLDEGWGQDGIPDCEWKKNSCRPNK